MANGVYSNAELVDTLIADLNNLIKTQMAGQHINACGIVYQMGQKLVNLRTGIKNDMDSRNKTIEALKNQLRNAGAEFNDVTAEELAERLKKDGVDDGSH